MKLVHFFYCPFTGLGSRNGYRGDVWLKNRIEVFKHFVLPSLKNQTNKNFILWISWRPEDIKNNIVINFVDELQEIEDLKIVNTFAGLCFWDDKYDDETAALRLRKALQKTLPTLSLFVGDDCDQVFMTIQPSDDLYMGNAVLELQAGEHDLWSVNGVPWNVYPRTVGFNKGYVMNYATKEIAEYNPTTIPPFATIRFPKRKFLDADYHMDYTGPYKSHEFVPHFRALPQRGFIVGTHGENISTTWNHPYKGRTILGEEREKILRDFGVLYSEPVVVKRPARLIARKIVNALPLNGILRKTYHALPPSWQIF